MGGESSWEGWRWGGRAVRREAGGQGEQLGGRQWAERAAWREAGGKAAGREAVDGESSWEGGKWAGRAAGREAGRQGERLGGMEAGGESSLGGREGTVYIACATGDECKKRAGSETHWKWGTLDVSRAQGSLCVCVFLVMYM